MSCKFTKCGVNMAFKELIGVDIAAEIEYFIKTDKALDERLVGLLKVLNSLNLA